MQPSAVPLEDRFFRALADLEASFETPVVSGELTDWLDAVARAWESLGVLLRGEVQRTHRESYLTILREDPDLSRQVEVLRAKDDQLTNLAFDRVTEGIKLLFDRAESAGQDELKTALLREEVIQEALAFIIEARTQETAIATWFSEAFNRDRGVGG